MTIPWKARHVVAAVLVGVLVGGGLMAITPAGADVAQAAAAGWKKIWKKDLQKHADKRYYTKKKTRKKFAKKSALDDFYTAPESDAKYQPKGSYAPAGASYTKAEVDAMLAPLINSVAATAGGDQNVTLTPADQVVRSVSIMPPADGTVIVSSSAYVNTVAAGIFRCSITPGSTIDFDHLQFLDSNEVSESHPIAGTRGFAVTKGSLFTVNLVCDEANGEAEVADSNLTAIFAPS